MRENSILRFFITNIYSVELIHNNMAAFKILSFETLIFIQNSEIL